MLRLFLLQADPASVRQGMVFCLLAFFALVESSMGLITTFFGATPKLTICLFFILTIRYPQTVTLMTAFMTGLVFDLVQGNPMGYTSSIYLIVFVAAELRRHVLRGADAGTMWVDFALLIFAIMVYTMVVFGIYERRMPPFAEIIFQTGLTILIFPVLNWIIELYRNIGLYFGGRG